MPPVSWMLMDGGRGGGENVMENGSVQGLWPASKHLFENKDELPALEHTDKKNTMLHEHISNAAQLFVQAFYTPWCSMSQSSPWDISLHSACTDFPREEPDGSEKAALGEPCSSHLLNYQNTRAKAGDYSVQTHKYIECRPKFLSCDFLCSYLLAPRHRH